MANVLYYYTAIHDVGCGCCHERVVEWELRDESGKVLVCNDYGEFEVHPDNVYL